MITEESLQLLLIGTFLGLTAGISPGPILTLVITQTLKHNRKEGILISISPLITDFPIIFITAFIFNKFSQFNTILGVISIAGGIFVAYLGLESVKFKGLDVDSQGSKIGSLKKGIITNFLNPHPYLFWATIGTPFIFRALNIHFMTLILFLFSFYALMVGSKITIAILVSRSKAFIRQKIYVVIIKLLGIILFLFSLFLFYDGVKYFKLA